MGNRRRNIFSTLIAFIYFFFFRKDEQPEIKYARKSEIFFLNSNNISMINKGSWWIITETESVPFKYNFDSEVDEKIAILNVNDYETAKLAAKLQIKEAGEILYLSNNTIFSNLGNREVKKAVEWYEVMDYFLFFWFYSFKEKFAGMKSFDEGIEVAQHLLSMIASVILNFIL